MVLPTHLDSALKKGPIIAAKLATKQLILFRACLLVSGLSIVGLAGCRSSISVTNTDASGSQQLLLNNSADSVICSFDFSPLAQRLCYLDTSGMGDEKDGYIRYRIRQRMITQGVRLTESRTDAEVIVEAGLAAYGTDSEKNDVGIVDVDSLPDIHLCIRGTQYGVAKLSMFAWERESGAAIWQTPVMRADSYQVVRTVFGLRPAYSGSIQHSANRVQVQDPPIRR